MLKQLTQYLCTPSDEAQAYAKESLELGQTFGLRPQLAMSLHVIGSIALARADLAQASSHFEETTAICRELSDSSTLSEVLCNHALICCSLNDLPTAKQYLREALTFASRNKVIAVKLAAVAGFARLAFLEGNVDYILELMRAVSVQRSNSDIQRWLEPLYHDLVARIGKDNLEEKLEESAPPTIDEIVQAILDEH